LTSALILKGVSLIVKVPAKMLLRTGG
jgi:hypothetical protein